ncbi:MAG TPA: hypothetical protein VN888_09055 [Mycobacterium sp.]|nr:hypothetical protein [Mycobacterium sp.]
MNCDVADATDLSGYEDRFDTVVDSALYHCLDDEGQQAYIAAPARRPSAPVLFLRRQRQRCDRADG